MEATIIVWWLNIVGPQPQSYMTLGYDSCKNAMIEYVTTIDKIYYIGCDVEPHPHAVNLLKQQRTYRGTHDVR
jgi:tryptophan synthase beta subunit